MKSKLNIFMKLMIAVLFVGIAINVSAQSNPYYHCDLKGQKAINLNLDVVGHNFNPDGGQWDMVNPTITSAADYNPATPGHQIAANVSNIFLVNGTNYGTYKFVYTANNSNSCLPSGTKVLATVIVLKSPVDVSHTMSLCPNVAGTIDLKTILSPELQSATFSNASTGTLTGSTLSIPASFAGLITVKYTIDHPNTAICENEATIYLTVNRDAQTPTLTGPTNINYCLKVMPKELNINSLISNHVPGGVWSVATTSGTGSATIANGIATFANPAAGTVLTFTYTWTKAGAGDCFEDGSLQFTVSILDDLSSAFVDNAITVCKNTTPNRVIDMLKEGLNVDIPLNSGTWSVIEKPVGSNVSITNGLFRVDEAKVGVYKYKFRVNQTSSTQILCGLAGKEAVLTINVDDNKGEPDVRIEFCDAKVSDMGTINFNNYINTIGAQWSGNGINAANGTIAGSALKALGIGVHQFNYTVTGSSCGDKKGFVYATITDAITLTPQTYKYCRPDLPRPIKLSAALGAAVPGTWTVTNDGGGTGSISNGTDEFVEAITTGPKTYVVKFTPAEGYCGATETTVTIQVDDDKF